MSTPQYDPRDVLDKYVAALNKPGNVSVLRDSAELAHPKDIIKFVLQHCIKAIDGADQQSFLRNAYLSLGSFHPLSDEERMAVAQLGELGPPAAPGTTEQEEQIKNLSGVAVPLQAALERVKAEVAILAQELKSLPGGA